MHEQQAPKIEINPQEVMMLAEQMLQGGWIKGQERGHASPTGWSDGQDPSGVCVVGALRGALTTVLRPQIELTLAVIPEFQVLQIPQQVRFTDSLTESTAASLLEVFRARIQKVLGGLQIESWNDASTRVKSDILAAMQASLETITQECLEAWSEPEAVTERSAEIEALVRA